MIVSPIHNALFIHCQSTTQCAILIVRTCTLVHCVTFDSQSPTWVVVLLLVSRLYTCTWWGGNLRLSVGYMRCCLGDCQSATWDVILMIVSRLHDGRHRLPVAAELRRVWEGSRAAAVWARRCPEAGLLTELHDRYAHRTTRQVPVCSQNYTTDTSTLTELHDRHSYARIPCSVLT